MEDSNFFTWYHWKIAFKKKTRISRFSGPAVLNTKCWSQCLRIEIHPHTPHLFRETVKSTTKIRKYANEVAIVHILQQNSHWIWRLVLSTIPLSYIPIHLCSPDPITTSIFTTRISAVRIVGVNTPMGGSVFELRPHNYHQCPHQD